MKAILLFALLVPVVINAQTVTPTGTGYLVIVPTGEEIAAANHQNDMVAEQAYLQGVENESNYLQGNTPARVRMGVTGPFKAPPLSFKTIYGFGAKSVPQIRTWLSRHGWRLKETAGDTTNPKLHTDFYEYLPLVDLVGNRAKGSLFSFTYEDSTIRDGQVIRLLRNISYSCTENKAYLQALLYVKEHHYTVARDTDDYRAAVIYSSDGQKIVLVKDLMMQVPHNHYFFLAFYPHT